IQPGNYKLLGKEAVISAFTLNVPPEENRLTRVPLEQIESLLGEGSVINADQKVDLSEALQNHWSQSVELLPTLMILLLLLLAVACLMILRPSLAYKEELRVPSTLLIVLDGSESMTIQDEADTKSRWAAMLQTLQQSEPVLQQLHDNQNINVVVYRFAEEAIP